MILGLALLGDDSYPAITGTSVPCHQLALLLPPVTVGNENAVVSALRPNRNVILAFLLARLRALLRRSRPRILLSTENQHRLSAFLKCANAERRRGRSTSGRIPRSSRTCSICC